MAPETTAAGGDSTWPNRSDEAETPAPSLRGRLIGLLLLAVLLTAAVQAFITWRTALAETEAAFDAQMERVALSLTGGLAASVLADDALASTRQAQDLIVQVWRADGTMLYRSPSARLLPPLLSTGFSDLRASATDYRVYVLQTRGQLVQVAQELSARRQAAGRVALRTVLPIALLAPVLMLIVWQVVSRALEPVERLRRQLAARRAGDLAPLAAAGLPAEVRPLVDELNGLLARLSAAWAALQHFTADAAHELRSPLAALRLQVQSLQRAATPEARQIASERLIAGVDRATRLVEQLLALARHEGRARAAPPQTVDLAALVRQAVHEAEPEAAARGLTLGADLADGPDSPLSLVGHPDALAVLLRNLLENALRYTPAQGRVRVSLRGDGQDGADLELVVEDSGPGIAPEDRQRVLDRFYRAPGAPGASGHGSGLGLAIVHAVAEQHGARLQLDASPSLGGLRVSVRLPRRRVQAEGDFQLQN